MQKSLFIFGLMLSGFSALINQVVWQRGLAKYLGGVESYSAMIVVMVFMLGLSFGAMALGRRARRILNPLRALANVEILLSLVNFFIMALFLRDLTFSVSKFQRLAMNLGLSLPVIYGLSALLILFVPCFLMGATMPLVSEAGEKQMRVRSPNFIPLMFAFNTLGSVAGALLGGWMMMPVLGYRVSLFIAIFCNATAGVIFFFQGRLSAHFKSQDSTDDEDISHTEPLNTDRLNSAAHVLSRPLQIFLVFALGAISLGYEMLLFRIFSLMDQPLPYVFSTVVALFLLFWSLGAFFSSKIHSYNLSIPLFLGGASLGMTMVVSLIITQTSGYRRMHDFFFINPVTMYSYNSMEILFLKSFYFLPCLFFGYLFGLLTKSTSQHWGKYVGYTLTSNTLGACFGLMAMTFVLFEGFSPWCNLLILTLSMLMLTVLLFRSMRRVFWMMAVGFVSLLAIGAHRNYEPFMPRVIHAYYGSGGVVGLDRKGNLFWDGLWHSALSDGASHVGTNNWKLAVFPAVFSPQLPRKSAVIGLGSGITAATLAKLETMESVDVYEINRKLKTLHQDYPEGTLHVIRNPKISVFWQDARIGLSLNEEKYDLIVTQPLYLKQAGSSYINSREFFQLVRQRLNPGGIFALYSNGSPHQAFTMRQTAKSVFKHQESFFKGYLILLSDREIPKDKVFLKERFERQSFFWDDVRFFRSTASPDEILKNLDSPRLNWGDGQFIIRDHRPFLEYPFWLKKMMNQHYGPLKLPTPQYHELGKGGSKIIFTSQFFKHEPRDSKKHEEV